MAELLVAVFGAQYPDWTVDEAVAELGAETAMPHSVLAVVNGIAVGCASLLDDDEVTGWPDRFWLGNVVVHADYRGRGIGTALIGAIETLARELRIAELHLVTGTAINWYERNGWSVQDSALVHGHPMTVMHKTLPPSTA